MTLPRKHIDPRIDEPEVFHPRLKRVQKSGDAKVVPAQPEIGGRSTTSF
jgi:hypothetical protein